LLGAAMLLVTGAIGAPAASANHPALVTVGSFDAPTYVAAPDGDNRRLFVVEREGVIRAMRDGQTLDRKFLDISKGVSTLGERGMFSMAFHPNYASNRRFYVFYTRPDGDIRIDEFRREPESLVRANPDSQRKVLRAEHSERENHNGGTIQFGPDGLLYVATGEAGGANDPFNHAQDTSSLLGKLLRIEPLPSGDDPYSIPASNPFVGGPGRDEIFALGLRNPFRFSFDRETGDLALADVGQNHREEVDFGTVADLSGANFGWDCFEGSRDNSEDADNPACPPSSHTPPVFEYSHDDGRCSITGGYVVRDPSLSIEGEYLYSDYCDGELRTVHLPPNGPESVVGRDVNNPVAFGEDGGGCLYVVSQGGKVKKLTPPDARDPTPC
jgi:glucose/arabinose dehydrogenase